MGVLRVTPFHARFLSPGAKRRGTQLTLRFIDSVAGPPENPMCRQSPRLGSLGACWQLIWGCARLYWGSSNRKFKWMRYCGIRPSPTPRIGGRLRSTTASVPGEPPLDRWAAGEMRLPRMSGNGTVLHVAATRWLGTWGRSAWWGKERMRKPPPSGTGSFFRFSAPIAVTRLNYHWSGRDSALITHSFCRRSGAGTGIDTRECVIFLTGKRLHLVCMQAAPRTGFDSGATILALGPCTWKEWDVRFVG